MRQHTGTSRGFRRHTLAAVAMVTVAISAAGCDTVKQAADKVTQLTAKETLLAAVPDDTEQPFRFTGKDATSEVSGSVDPANKGLHLSMSVKDTELGFTTNMAFLIIGNDHWVKINFTGAKGVTGLPKLPATWMRVDTAKLSDKESVPSYDGADQGNTGPLLQAATSVDDSGGGRYAGTIDLTSGEAAKVLEAEQMTVLGEAAKKVPFEAVVGSEQHLASLTLKIPAAGSMKAYDYVVNYTDYGKAPNLEPPTGNAVRNAPPVVYEMLNA